MSEPPGISYRCCRCGKPVERYDAKVRPDGKLEITGHCHGESFTVIMWLGIGGAVFLPHSGAGSGSANSSST